jgi:hypothetical protein
VDYDALRRPVAAFIEDVGADLLRISAGLPTDAATSPGGHAAGDVTVEAFNLAAAMVDGDDIHSDTEVWALIETFGPRFDTMLGLATPAEVRNAGLLVDSKAWLDKPSTLFEILCADDARAGGRGAWRYYERAMAIAHTVASLNEAPSTFTLGAIERFRAVLLGAMRAAKGTTAVTRAGPTPAAPAKAAGPAVTPDPPRPLPELLDQLDDLVGLAGVKGEVKLVTNLLQVQRLRRERSMPVAEHSHHLVFTGNPGTGKTTVARLLAEIYRTLGVVSKGHLVETDRAGLVVGYVGQTATQVTKVVTSALGGVLLIDEAYALARGGDRDFGQEAIDTLVKLLEDHRDDVVVIAAGYPEEMAEFIGANPGLSSRFPRTIAFPDYSTDELVAIFDGLCRTNGYSCQGPSLGAVTAVFEAVPRTKGFGNGRVARNLFEAAVERQAGRVVALTAPTDDDLRTFSAVDIPPAADVGGPSAAT